jgi:hypothetical protein
MTHRSRIAGVLGGSLLLALCCTGCCKDKTDAPTTDVPGTTPETPTATATEKPKAPTIKTMKVGETATLADYKLEVKEAKECKASGYWRPKKDHKWIGVDTVFESLGDKEFWANPSSAKVTDSEGVVHNVTYAAKSSCGESLKSARLNQGEKAKGWILFEVPKASKGFVMTYSKLISFGDNQSVKFELGL